MCPVLGDPCANPTATELTQLTSALIEVADLELGSADAARVPEDAARTAASPAGGIAHHALVVAPVAEAFEAAHGRVVLGHCAGLQVVVAGILAHGCNEKDSTSKNVGGERGG